MLDPQRAILADDRMKKAQRLVDAVHEKRTAEAEVNRQSYERFYNQLVLICGGTVALSVTYLGYLKTTQSSIIHPGLLVTSWIALLLCLVISAFANFFYSFYMTFSRQAEYANRLAEMLEVEANELPYVGHLPVLTPSELARTIEERRETAKARQKDSRWNERRANVYWLVWKWGGLCARLAFVLGIASLIVFAIFNFQNSPGLAIPVKKP
jgi:hypothetical protein